MLILTTLKVLALSVVLVLPAAGAIGPEIFGNWESGTFIDRAPGIPVVGSPVFTFAYTQADSQLWYYTWNDNLTGDALVFTLTPPPPYDNIFVGVKDNKLRLQSQPTLFTNTYPPYDPTVAILGLYGTDLVITASRVHGAQLTLEPRNITNPLQQWQEYRGFDPLGRGVYLVENWETGCFLDRRPGFAEYGTPVTSFPFTQELTQKWDYAFNGTKDGETLFTMGGTPGDPIDIFYISTDNGKRLSIGSLPTVFSLSSVAGSSSEPAYMLTIPLADKAVTAPRAHGAQLTLQTVDPNNPLQHWRFYVPTI